MLRVRCKLNDISLASFSSFWRKWKLCCGRSLRIFTLCLHLKLYIICHLESQSDQKTFLYAMWGLQGYALNVKGVLEEVKRLGV